MSRGDPLANVLRRRSDLFDTENESGDESPVSIAGSDNDSDVDDESECEVSCITNVRFVEAKKEIEYYVVWVGYEDNEEENCWVPEENVEGCPQKVEEFLRSERGQRKWQKVQKKRKKHQQQRRAVMETRSLPAGRTRRLSTSSARTSRSSIERKRRRVLPSSSSSSGDEDRRACREVRGGSKERRRVIVEDDEDDDEVMDLTGNSSPELGFRTVSPTRPQPAAGSAIPLPAPPTIDQPNSSAVSAQQPSSAESETSTTAIVGPSQERAGTSNRPEHVPPLPNRPPMARQSAKQRLKERYRETEGASNYISPLSTDSITFSGQSSSHATGGAASSAENSSASIENVGSATGICEPTTSAMQDKASHAGVSTQPRATLRQSTPKSAVSEPASCPVNTPQAANTQEGTSPQPRSGKPIPLPPPEPRADQAIPLPPPEPRADQAIPLPPPEPRADQAIPLPPPEPRADQAIPLPPPEPRADQAIPLPPPEPRADQAIPLPPPEPRADQAIPLPPPEPRADQAIPLPPTNPRADQAIPLPPPEPRADQAIPLPPPEPRADQAIPLPPPEPRADQAIPLPPPEPRADQAIPLPPPEPRADQAIPLPPPEPRADQAIPLPPPEPRADQAIPLPPTNPRADQAIPLPPPEPRADQAIPLPPPEPRADQAIPLPPPEPRSMHSLPLPSSSVQGQHGGVVTDQVPDDHVLQAPRPIDYIDQLMAESVRQAREDQEEPEGSEDECSLPLHEDARSSSDEYHDVQLPECSSDADSHLDRHPTPPESLDASGVSMPDVLPSPVSGDNAYMIDEDLMRALPSREVLLQNYDAVMKILDDGMRECDELTAKLMEPPLDVENETVTDLLSNEEFIADPDFTSFVRLEADRQRTIQRAREAVAKLNLSEGASVEQRSKEMRSMALGGCVEQLGAALSTSSTEVLASTTLAQYNITLLHHIATRPKCSDMCDIPCNGMWCAVMRMLVIPPGDLCTGLAVNEATSDTLTTALMLAAKEDIPCRIRTLATLGASVDQRDESGKTALAHAIQQGRVVAVQTLLTCGADLSQRFDASAFDAVGEQEKRLTALDIAEHEAAYYRNDKREAVYEHVNDYLQKTEESQVKAIRELLRIGDRDGTSSVICCLNYHISPLFTFKASKSEVVLQFDSDTTLQKRQNPMIVTTVALRDEAGFATTECKTTGDCPIESITFNEDDTTDMDSAFLVCARAPVRVGSNVLRVLLKEGCEGTVLRLRVYCVACKKRK